jgi:hypothetical protein
MNTTPKHGMISSCDPKGSIQLFETFSIGFFQLVPRKSGKGMKRGRVIYRLYGPCNQRDRMFARAEQIVQMLDSGWNPGKKSERLK